MHLSNGEWINGYFVEIVMSIERIYVQIRYYNFGASIEQGPIFEKTAILENSEINRHFVKAYKSTLVEYIAQLPISAGECAVVCPQLTEVQKRLLK